MAPTADAIPVVVAEFVRNVKDGTARLGDDIVAIGVRFVRIPVQQDAAIANFRGHLMQPIDQPSELLAPQLDVQDVL
jgi:hypothetical protein